MKNNIYKFVSLQPINNCSFNLNGLILCNEEINMVNIIDGVYISKDDYNKIIEYRKQ